MNKKQQLLARFKLLEFIKAFRPASHPLIVGRHTKAITDRLDKAIYDYSKGISSYIIITVPFRHGKSEIASRHFPPFFLGHNPNSEVILATYGQGLSNSLSRDARSVIKEPLYRQVFPNVALSKESSSVQDWGIANFKGKFQAATVGAGVTGKGADLLIIDDYIRGRSVAESALIRQTQWDNFAGNLMTRLAPVHIVLILATPWHVDDIIGRIKKQIDPESEEYNPEFPPFELMKFPAKDINGQYLFPERFSEEWYIKQFATLGNYQSASLLQCEPTIQGGNMLNTSNINIVDEFPDGLHFVRFWDLASTEKELAKKDPDRTVGALVAVRKENDLYHLYVKEVVYCQAEAPQRDRLIEETAERDGSSVPIGVESVAGYKDTYTNMKAILKGKSIVHKANVFKDKVVRAGAVAPLFDAGHVYFLRGYWNRAVTEELSQFPSGTHDDMVDAITGGFAFATKNSGESRIIC